MSKFKRKAVAEKPKPKEREPAVEQRIRPSEGDRASQVRTPVVPEPKDTLVDERTPVDLPIVEPDEVVPEKEVLKAPQAQLPSLEQIKAVVRDVVSKGLGEITKRVESLEATVKQLKETPAPEAGVTVEFVDSKVAGVRRELNELRQVTALKENTPSREEFDAIEEDVGRIDEGLENLVGRDGERTEGMVRVHKEVVQRVIVEYILDAKDESEVSVSLGRVQKNFGEDFVPDCVGGFIKNPDELKETVAMVKHRRAYKQLKGEPRLDKDREKVDTQAKGLHNLLSKVYEGDE